MMKLLSTRQAADLLGISKRTLEAMRLSGRGPRYTKVGRLVRYTDDLLDKWLLFKSTHFYFQLTPRRHSHDHIIVYPSSVDYPLSCEICGYKPSEHDIDIAGISAEGEFLAICSSCLEVPVRLLSMIIPSTASPTITQGALRQIGILGSRRRRDQIST